MLIGLKSLAFITITVSFSDVLRYARDTSNAGPGMSDSTSRENVTEGRCGGTVSTTCSSAYGRKDKMVYSTVEDE